MTPTRNHCDDAARTGQVLRRSWPSSRARSWCSATAPAAVSALDLELLARSCRHSVRPWCGSSSPGVRPGARSARHRRKLDEAWLAALGWLVEQEWARASAGRRRPECRRSGGLPDRVGHESRWRSSAWRSRCTCRVGPRSPGCRAAGPHRAEAGPAGHQGQLRQSGGDSCGDRRQPGHPVVDLPGADHGYRIGLKARSAASGASNRATEIAQASSLYAR